MPRLELLLGCGRNREKKLYVPGHENWENLVTLDNNPDVEPHIIYDLNQNRLPVLADSVDEIHAYECLEHCGTQGDYRFFFSQFEDFYRVLKPDGIIFGTVPLPTSIWAWGDPSHTRVLPKENLLFLHQPQYKYVKTSPMSDFRYMYWADFDIIHLNEVDETLQFGLRAIKPSRRYQDEVQTTGN